MKVFFFYSYFIFISFPSKNKYIHVKLYLKKLIKLPETLSWTTHCIFITELFFGCNVFSFFELLFFIYFCFFFVNVCICGFKQPATLTRNVIDTLPGLCGTAQCL